MGLPREGGDGETRRDASGANEERASSCYYSSSSSSSSASAMSTSCDEAAAAYDRASSRQHGSEPPAAQQMDRPSSTEEGGAGEPGRIPAAVFERDPSESNKDWSMMSTDSVFALQVAPSSDFTGFFLAHPELMDIATPPRASAFAAAADADGRVHSTQFESIPELGEATMQMQGHYSFAFPTLIEVKRHSSKNPQEEHPMAAKMATATTMTETTAPAPVKAEMSSKQEEAPAKAASKGGWLPCFPCC
ncbi:hypothetical protein E2562_004768 [Oryza meyeriana var. granulata]|uniref:Uncharacterized protein n=1 Tax=Oryza meyeriana var. granulata TaxID=110450 RepID=A0A6G1DEC5_9ORYZ|nr:hypothetical protein E2562_004768 [Oryza meyeriana var. granulata]